MDQQRVKKWLSHFDHLNNIDEWHKVHVSGHGSQDQLGRIIQESKSHSVIAIHTEHNEYYAQFHNNVRQIEINDSIEI